MHFTCSSSTRARFLSTSYTASSLFFSFPTETLLYFSYEVFDIGMITFCLFKVKTGTVNSGARPLENKMLAIIVWTIINNYVKYCLLIMVPDAIKWKKSMTKNSSKNPFLLIMSNLGQFILFEIDCAIFYANLHELFS